MSLPAGTRLGPYEVIAPIGAGGMGEVYRARDTRLGRDVAVKVLPASLAADPQFRDRFEREGKSISQLNHPHICTLYDVGETADAPPVLYLVMEYLEGETLAARLTKGAVPLADALRIAVEIASALDKAHRQGIVHRDLKPGNIMLTKTGSKLLDFGLAKLGVLSGVAAGAPTALATSPLPSMQSPALTAQGTILGTLQYMAPEQVGLQISKASVTNMVQRLDGEGLLKYEKFRGLVLTTAGEALAQNITHRHQLLTDFLKLLGLNDEVIYHDVEGMEHHISPPTLRAIEALTSQLQRQPALLAKVRKVTDEN